MLIKWYEDISCFQRDRKIFDELNVWTDAGSYFCYESNFKDIKQRKALLVLRKCFGEENLSNEIFSVKK